MVVPVLWLWHGWDEQEKIEHSEIQELVLEKFDDFVYDMHTRKGKFKKDKQDFVSEGAVVLNEDTNAVNYEMKRLYEKQLTPIRSIHVPIFCDVQMITKGLCGGKLPCFYATFRGERKVIKPFTESLNFGLDYAYVDFQKQKFGIPSLNVKLVSIERLAVEKNNQGDFFLNINSETVQVFAIMDEIKHKGDLGKNKDILDDETKYDEMLKIRLFNGIFRTSDNIIRNILVDRSNNLVPIDENDILGKRTKIFNSTEPIKQNRFWKKERLIRIVNDLCLEKHKNSILAELFSFELQSKNDELGNRIDNYKDIVVCEFEKIPSETK